MNITFSIRTHKGNKRAGNEDNFFTNGIILTPELYDKPFSFDAYMPAPIVLAVCDGMGGEERGELASGIAVQKLKELQHTILNTSSKNLPKAVQTYIKAANDEINSFGVRTGTTIALAVINKKGIYCFNVGDTRIYCFRGSNFKQVTNDHTQGAEIAGSGIISMKQARRKKDGYKLTRCIGFGNCYNMDSYPVIKEKCRLLICSDGLTDMVSDSEIKNILASITETSGAAEQLLKSALDNGGNDNVTVITADIPFTSFLSPIIKNRR